MSDEELKKRLDRIDERIGFIYGLACVVIAVGVVICMLKFAAHAVAALMK